MQKRIVHLTRLYSPHIGGVERHVAGLSRELARRGHRVIIVTEQYEPGLKLAEKSEGLKILRIPYPALSSKRGVWSWMRHHQELFVQADIVHIHDVFWWYIQLLNKKPFFITFHGYEGNKPPRWQAVVQRKFAEKLAHGTICIGDFMRRWYRANPNLVLYGAAEVKAKKGAKENDEAVYWGRLDLDAGIDVYMQALRLITKPLRLFVYGEGPVKVEKSPRITYKGVSRSIELELGRAQWAFVSRYLSILEAMQAKMMVAAVYNNQIKRDYLECHPQRENMIIAGGAQELASKIDLMTQAEREDKIERAYAWAKSQTFNALADAYEKLWQI